MKTEGEFQLLRIFIGESDRWDGRPLYEAIVRMARDQGLAGATALRGIEGFGANDRIHTVKILRLSEDLPIVVEIVDRPERIAAFLPTLDGIIAEGMITLEKVRTIVYRRESGDVQPQADDEIPLDTSEYSPSPVFEAAADPLADGARKIIDAAKESAADSRRVFVDSVDVLLAMLREHNGITGRVLTELGIDSKTVARSLRELVSRDETSGAFLEALQEKSAAAARWLGHDSVGTEHLLLALCEIRPNAATDILMRLGAQPRDICCQVLKIVERDDDWQRWLADHPNM
jgi:PII-like signaling protein